jgi:aspartate/methionine/tyrosine aminotransferase
MVPIPQYPLYSALIAKLTGTQVDYYLDEENNWAASKQTLEEELKKSILDGVDVKALVIINPGTSIFSFDKGVIDFSTT